MNSTRLPPREAPAGARGDADAVIYRVAVAAFTHYPTRHLDEPEYEVDEDVAWCLEPLACPTDEARAMMAEWVREIITNPLADRQEFIELFSRQAERG